MKVVGMEGLRFGFLVVLKRVENNNMGQAVWLCECDCGNKKEYVGIRLRNKPPLSCGCDLKKLTKNWGKVGGLRHGSGRKPKSLYERIKNRYTINKTTGCWIWKGHTKSNKFGYGRIYYNGRYTTAHRGAYIAKYGDIPEGLCVCHKCDVPACVNPDHLFLGTHQDNMVDCSKKGRLLKGESSPLSKLKTKDILKIRSMYKYKVPGSTSVDLAKTFGVRPSTILRVVNKKCWKHV